MYQDEFLPVVFNVRLSSNQALPVEKWRSRIYDVLHLYVDQICKNEEHMIGHIKALAQIDEHDFIKYSCVSSNNVINSKFHGEHKEVFNINMIVNSLVSNISEDESRVFLERSCRSLEKRDSIISIAIENTQERPVSHHHHDHGDGDDCPICNSHHHN
ncbi:MAG: hypothetical protein PWP56_1723 [Acetobacterium sp.]|nr:hypothetical protein [Acetobacterium sp.]